MSEPESAAELIGVRHRPTSQLIVTAAEGGFAAAGTGAREQRRVSKEHTLPSRERAREQERAASMQQGVTRTAGAVGI